MIFSSMLCTFEMYQQKQGSCLVYIREISECYISGITQDLQFTFQVPIRNTIIKNSQDFKKAYEILLISGYTPLRVKLDSLFKPNPIVMEVK
jgi:hypothetical protein